MASRGGGGDNGVVLVEVGLLGPVELWIDGMPAGLGGAPQRILLARLALATGRVVPAGDLIDALWDGAPPDNAVGNLHSYVSRWYDRSLERTDAIDQVYTGNIARVARTAVLIRLGRHREAVAACRRTIGAVRDVGMIAQLWTILRLTAELLADLGEPEAAARIVAAADADPYAPAVMGPDRDRQACLRAGAPSPAVPGDLAATAEFALAALDRQAA
jgi:hypothetical protein